MNPTTDQPEDKIPSREDMLNFYRERIELMNLQTELQQLKTAFAKAQAEELQALAYIDQFKQNSEAKMDTDEEELDNVKPMN